MSKSIKSTESLTGLARRAKAAGRVLAALPAETRNAILIAVASSIETASDEILVANERDCDKLKDEVLSGRVSQAFFDRLRTSSSGVVDMAAKVRAVAELPDPIARTLAVTVLSENLTLHKITCPLGVIGIIFESRPDVIPQISALCVKSGNAVVLKGGSEAVSTNAVLAGIWHKALSEFGLPVEAVSLVHTRDEVAALLELRGLIDLIIPRGSKDFVNHIETHSSIPVLGHGEGICHIYVDEAADLAKGWKIALDAKTNYPAACNAVETLLVHARVAEKFLPEMIKRFQTAGVEVRGCKQTRGLLGALSVAEASEADWSQEYGDLIIAVKVVESLDEALDHIEQYGSQHTEAIITENLRTAERFMDLVDAAGVYQNASTRFADGFRYGLGAEIGISTSKLHARGPVGLEGLVTYKYKLYGDGQTVGD